MGALVALAAVKLIKWAADQKSFAAFVAVSVAPVGFVLLGVFGLWAGPRWGMFPTAIAIAAGLIAAAMLIIGAGQLIRIESVERRRL